MKLKSFFAFLLISSIIFSCKKKETETDNLFKFRDYISYTTSGRVSVAEDININLAKVVEGWETNQVLDNSLLKISPYVEGKTIVVNDHAIRFVPDENLKPDTEYSVSINLDNLYSDIPSEFKKYSFNFKTITPNFNIETTSLQSYSKEWQYLLGVIKTSDVVTLEDAKRLVEASQKGKKLTIVWNENNQPSKYFEFKIDSINRQVEDTDILVKWNGKPIKADNSGENTKAAKF